MIVRLDRRIPPVQIPSALLQVDDSIEFVVGGSHGCPASSNSLSRAPRRVFPQQSAAAKPGHCRPDPGLAIQTRACARRARAGNGLRERRRAGGARRVGASGLCGVDVEHDAIEQASKLLDTLGYGHIAEFYRGDMWRPVTGRSFDLVVANLPQFPTDFKTSSGRFPSWSWGGTDGRDMLDRFLGG